MTGVLYKCDVANFNIELIYPAIVLLQFAKLQKSFWKRVWALKKMGFFQKISIKMDKNKIFVLSRVQSFFSPPF